MQRYKPRHAQRQGGMRANVRRNLYVKRYEGRCAKGVCENCEHNAICKDVGARVQRLDIRGQRFVISGWHVCKGVEACAQRYIYIYTR